MFCLLHAVLHDMEALVYNNYPRKAAASTCLAIIFRRIASIVPPLNSGPNVDPTSV